MKSLIIFSMSLLLGATMVFATPIANEPTKPVGGGPIIAIVPDPAVFRAIPNPSDGISTLDLVNENDEIQSVVVRNLAGVVCFSQTNEGNVCAVDFTILPKGSYLLEMTISGQTRTYLMQVSM